MDILLVDRHQPVASADLFDAVVAAGIEVERRDVYVECPEAINEWGIASVPCLVRVVDGRAVHQVSNPEAVSSFLADAPQ